MKQVTKHTAITQDIVFPNQDNKTVSAKTTNLPVKKSNAQRIIDTPESLKKWEVKQSVTIILKMYELVKKFDKAKVRIPKQS